VLKFLTLYDLYLLCVIALMKIAGRSASFRLGRFLACTAGFTAWRLSRRRRRSRERNLAQTVNLSEAEIRHIVKKCFYEFWQGVFCLPSYGSRRPVRQPVELRGLEHLQKALMKGKGVILWESNSFGKRVLAKRVLHGNGVSVCQVHGQNHLEGFYNSKSWIAINVIRPFFENCERPFVKEIIYLPISELSFSRTLLERLKQNAIICIAGDGKQGHKFIPVRFLGQTEFFSTGMVSLAKLSGTTILPLFCIQENGENASVIIEGPIYIETNEDRERCLEKSIRQYATLLESYILRYPEQYWNWRLPGATEAARTSPATTSFPVNH
jgi:lauroyl/myristoyl acyltransferase